MTENWKNIPGYEGLYQASNLGGIRSLDRTVPTRRWESSSRRIKGLLIKQYLNTVTGYLHVKLNLNGRKKTHSVHRLVASAWIGGCPEGQEVRHGPNGKTDNSAHHLRYGTRRENHLDKRRDGTSGKRVKRDDGIEYPNATMASEQMCCSPHTIATACRRGSVSMKHTWKYI